jgi:hypothetical protein
MKAERRHELQTNSLALWLQLRLPEIWQKYGNHILLGLIILIGAFWFVRWRYEAPRKAANEAANALASIEMTLNAARSPDDTGDIPQRIADALTISDNKDVQALGFVLLGEYQWTLATQPQPLTSRPSKSTPEDLYKKADDAFRNSLAAGSQQMDLIVRARFGRAIVAEQQAFELALKDNFKSDPSTNPYWRIARAEYEAVAKDPNVIGAFHKEAKWKLEQLGKMETQPVWIGKAPPTSMPNLEMPDTRPAATTRPATRP